MSELWDLDASRLAELVRAREISPVESVQACLDRIDAVNGAVNAFVYVSPAGMACCEIPGTPSWANGTSTP